MRKILKWIGIVLAALVGLIIVAVIGSLVYGSASFKRTYDRPVYEIQADTSPEGVARGEYLVRTVIACGGCHGAGEEDLEKVSGPLVGDFEEFSDGPFSGVFAAPNLTSDRETGLGDWTDAEIARAIREGLDNEGVELVVMPSAEFHGLSDPDVAAIVGYLRSLEPVRNEIPPFSASAFVKAALAIGLFGPRNLTEPITALQTSPPSGTAEYGGYLLGLAPCAFCHGENFAGGPVPDAEPGSPPAANLTPAGELAGWTEAGFIMTMRTGVTPSGRGLDNDFMPWTVFSNMTDVDLGAIFKYLQMLPPAEP